MSAPQAPSIIRLTASMAANAPANTLTQMTINWPGLFGGEYQQSFIQLNVPFKILDGYISAAISPDAQILVNVNDGQKFIWSNKLNDTLMQTGRPRVPLFDKPILVRPGTKLTFHLRNIDAVGSSAVNVTVYLKVSFQ